MNFDTPIIIFAYSFPHKKSFDFISIISAKGYSNLIVIGAPKVTLRHNVNQSSDSNASANFFDVQNLCSSLSIPFIECPHDDVKAISMASTSIGAEIAIVAGARILQANIIDIFPKGVVNFHPGKIPETSGLDSFYYTLKSGSSMGVTVHLIDERVDAGELIFFEKLRVLSEDTYDSIKHSLYLTQLRALHRFLDIFFLDGIACIPIHRPKKNRPLDVDEKKIIKDGFDAWKIQQIKSNRDIENNFFTMCVEGDLAEVKKLISKNLYLLNLKDSNGWSAIIIAAFWQHELLVKYLLKMGADPNDYGNNGTTVLMYSKTKLLDERDPSLRIISALISSGAKVHTTDNYGKDIFHYLDSKKKSSDIIRNYLNTLIT
jgi:ankyrin repeat protein